MRLQDGSSNSICGEDGDGYDKGDISDGEFERVKQRFQNLLPKFGTLWRTMHAEKQHVNKEDDAYRAREDCVDGCCRPTGSFLPEYLLEAKVDAESETLPPLQVVNAVQTGDDQPCERFEASTESKVNSERLTNMEDSGLIDDDAIGSDSEHLFNDPRENRIPSDLYASQNNDPDREEISHDSNTGLERSFESSDDEGSCSDSTQSTRIAWDDWKSPEECLAEKTVEETKAPGTNLLEQDRPKQEIVLTKQRPQPSISSGVIDLVSSSDDEHKSFSVFSIGSGNDSFSGSKIQSLKKHNSDKIVDLVDTSEEEYTWDVNESTDNNSKRLARSCDDQVLSLTDLTNRLTIHENEESDESSIHNRKEKKKVERRHVSSFKRKCQELSQKLFVEYDRALSNGRLARCTTVEWSNKLRTTAGLTRLMKPRGGNDSDRKAVIELSTKVLDDEKRLRETLLHEMCHAAAFVVDGITKPPHGQCFKKWARLAMEKVPGAIVTVKHDYEIQYKYAWACVSSSCNFVVKRHSRSVDVEKHICPLCKSRLTGIEATYDGNITKMKRRKQEPSAYNNYIQDNFADVRERLLREGGAVSNTEVMKECGRLWREKNQDSKEIVELLAE